MVQYSLLQRQGSQALVGIQVFTTTEMVFLSESEIGQTHIVRVPPDLEP